jgi:hypothetical protein
VSRLFGSIAQIGYVVDDIESSMQRWIDHCVGPWFYVEHVETDYFRHRGVDSPVELSIALASSGDVQLELIQQRNDAPSMYRELLDAGRTGAQHVAYWTRDYQTLYDRALDFGYRVGQEGCIGGDAGRFCYFDTEHEQGTVIELSDISGPKGQFFAHIRRAAETWDGSRPIRSVS